MHVRISGLDAEVALWVYDEAVVGVDVPACVRRVVLDSIILLPTLLCPQHDIRFPDPTSGWTCHPSSGHCSYADGTDFADKVEVAGQSSSDG